MNPESFSSESGSSSAESCPLAGFDSEARDRAHELLREFDEREATRSSRRKVVRNLALLGIGGAVAWAILDGRVGQTARKVAETVQKKKTGRGYQTGKLANEDEFVAFVGQLNLDFISPQEVVKPHRNILNGVKNELPPKEMWNEILEPLKLANELRRRLGVPLNLINSAYRCPAYNAECGGVKGSWHMKNRALDLMFACPAASAAEEARKMREEGVFQGGIGVYPTFIHIDNRGRNANWGSA